MAEVKWIKIVTNIFDDEKIRYIETLPSGDEIIVIWFKILCLCGKSNSSGLLMMTDRIAYTDQMLSSIFNRDVKSINLALSVFEQLDMIEKMDNKIYLTNWEKYQTLDYFEKKKIYDREYQKKKRKDKLLTNNVESYDNRTIIVKNRDTDIELDIEEELELKDNTNVVKKKKTERLKFFKPTLEQLEYFINANLFNVDAEAFYDYYESNGWLVGKNKMKSWEATVRTWHRNNNKNTTNTKKKIDIMSL